MWSGKDNPKISLSQLPPGKGRCHLSPYTASDSRHNLSQRTTLRRGAPGRVRLRVLTRRLAAGVDKSFYVV